MPSHCGRSGLCTSQVPLGVLLFDHNRMCSCHAPKPHDTMCSRFPSWVLIVHRAIKAGSLLYSTCGVGFRYKDNSIF